MGDRKCRMISMRVTEKQYRYLDDMARRIKQQTGFHITRASIILKLMEYGLPALEREFPRHARSNDEDDDQLSSA